VKHRRFPILTAISMLVFVVLAVRWFIPSPESSWSYQWGNPVNATGYWISLSQGGLSVGNSRGVRPVMNGIIRAGNHVGWDVLGIHRHRWDTIAAKMDGTPRPGTFGTSAEFWIDIKWFLLLAVILPLKWFVRYLRTDRSVPRGICAKCGYDLRATPDRCPECGTCPPRQRGRYAALFGGSRV
jgi:hypothetical protein